MVKIIHLVLRLIIQLDSTTPNGTVDTTPNNRTSSNEADSSDRKR